MDFGNSYACHIIFSVVAKTHPTDSTQICIIKITGVNLKRPIADQEGPGLHFPLLGCLVPGQTLAYSAG